MNSIFLAFAIYQFTLWLKVPVWINVIQGEPDYQGLYRAVNLHPIING